MVTVTVANKIAAPVERVFSLFTDLDHCAGLVTGIKKIEVLTAPPFGLRTRWLETREVLGREVTEELEVTAFEMNHAYTVTNDVHGARMDTEAVTLGAHAADEALGEDGLPDPAVPLAPGSGVLERDGDGHLKLHACGACLADERRPVEKLCNLAVSPNVQRTSQRRWKSERHFDLARIDERRQPPARVATVRRRERAAVTPVEDDLHEIETSKLEFVTERRKP